jgi:hypothetical protein
MMFENGFPKWEWLNGCDDNIQKAVVICLIIPTTFPFDAGSRVDNVHHTSRYFFMLDPALKGNIVFAPLCRMGPRCSSAETQVCHRSYIIAARVKHS